VTGAANGIGLAISRRAATEGMVVVMADVDDQALAAAGAPLAAEGLDVHTMPVDVSIRESVQTLAARVADEIGDAWLLVNNAGVIVARPFVESTVSEWEFMLGTDLWGVVHGHHAFLPGMMARDSGYVVSTASLVGVVTNPGSSGYIAAKHAVVGLSETLYRELDLAGSNVGISVLCPGIIDTRVMESVRLWPDRLGPRPQSVRTRSAAARDHVMQPAEVADIVFRGIAERRFWIVTHPELYAAAIRARAEGIIAGRNPGDDSVDPNFRSRRNAADR
jgi:NAD(P)-dependent dehydrogenase (short-subunit alcohol dehydrogenase family)